MKNVLAASSLMLILVFAGCSATGPFQPHSAFKQSLPSGYYSAYQNQNGYGGAPGFSAGQWQSANYPPAYAPQNWAPQYHNPGIGHGALHQSGYPLGGQAAYPQNKPGLGGGLMSPFVGSTYTSGSC